MLQIVLLILSYALGLGALTLLAWRDPRRLSIAARQQKTDTQAPLQGWRRNGLVTLVATPLYHAVWQGDSAAALIAVGVLLCFGWILGLCFAVQRPNSQP